MQVTIEQGEEEKVWKYYDFGPRKVKCPLICLPSASGGSECYFKQVYGLGSQGYRVIAVRSPLGSSIPPFHAPSFYLPPPPLLQVEYPDYWTHESWCEGFTKFIDHLNLDKVSFLLAQVSNWEPPPTRSLSPSRSTSSGLPWVAIWHRYSRSTRACGSSPSFSATPLLTRETLPRTRLSLDCIAPPLPTSHPIHRIRTFTEDPLLAFSFLP